MARNRKASSFAEIAALQQTLLAMAYELMTIPSLLFALLVALLYGALYHFLRGGRFWRLILYFGLSILGFAVGQLISFWQGWLFIPFGSLDLGSASIGSLIFLVGGDWLSRIETQRESKV